MSGTALSAVLTLDMVLPGKMAVASIVDLPQELGRGSLLAEPGTLWSYARGTKSPVLTWHMSLCAQYEISGTNFAYGGTRFQRI